MRYDHRPSRPVRTAGDRIVRFDPSPIYDQSDFTPLEYSGADRVEIDMTENQGEVVRDVLADRPSRTLIVGRRRPSTARRLANLIE